MKAFDPNYKLLDEMYQDEYYPDFLVDKIKDELQKVIDLLESGETDTEAIQETLDGAVRGINDLQDEFYENDSEIETVARDCIGVTVAYILEWFGIPIDMEEAIRERDLVMTMAIEDMFGRSAQNRHPGGKQSRRSVNGFCMQRFC